MMRRFFVPPEQIGEASATLTGSEARQIRAVLRLEAGDAVQLFDRAGFEYDALIDRIGPDAVELSILHRYPQQVQPVLRLAVAQAMLKEKKMDKLLRQLCELGMTHWMPFVSGRSVARPPRKRLEHRRERWEKIALSAMKQCGRSDPIDIGHPMLFEDILTRSADYDTRIVFWEGAAGRCGLNHILEKHRTPDSVMIMLGPEGGLASVEVAAARKAGFITAGLGPRILRAETAALTACALVQYLFGDLGQKALDKK